MTREAPDASFQPSELPPGLVPVMFTTDWCGYCRRFLPHFRSVPGGRIVDISDDDDPLWDRLGIRVVPTVILFENGMPTQRWAGALNATHADSIRAAVQG